jgi:hypothetical protein
MIGTPNLSSGLVIDMKPTHSGVCEVDEQMRDRQKMKTDAFYRAMYAAHRGQKEKADSTVETRVRAALRWDAVP